MCQTAGKQGKQSIRNDLDTGVDEHRMAIMDAAAPVSILKTKVYMPPPHGNLVLRPRLLQRLAHALAHPLTLICAPAGFGKTTLIADFRRHCGQPGGFVDLAGLPNGIADARFAWLSLEERDNDPAPFVTYLIAALQQIQPLVGQTVLQLLQTPNPPAPMSLLPALLNELAALPPDALVVLILDDYHVIGDSRVHDLIAFFVEHLPAQVRLVLTSRSDPPLPLSRWRVRGQLCEVRAADLRFTGAEIAEFFQQATGLPLLPEQVAVLERQTEGWIAALQLAAISLHGGHNADALVNAVRGSQRYIMDYLVDEVLQQQPRHIQRFLLATSILERFCAPLCDAILAGDPALAEEHSAAATLNTLEQANLFLIPLDDERRWFRYHHLFSAFLRSLIAAEDQERLRALHRRAALWFAGEKLVPEAIEHALAAHAYDEAAQLIGEIAAEIWMRGDIRGLDGWLERLPRDVLLSHPGLCIVKASTALLSGPLQAVEPWLQAAEARMAAVPAPDAPRWRSEILAIRANLSSFRGDIEQTIALCQSALAEIEDNQPVLRAAVLQALGFAHRLAGNVAQASAIFIEIAEICRRAGDSFWMADALNNLIVTYLTAGRLQAAAATARELLARLVDGTGQLLPIAGTTCLLLSEILLEWNDLAGAEEYLERGLSLGEQAGNIDTLLIGHFRRALVRQAQGDGAAALAAIREAREVARRFEVPHAEVYTAALQARIWLAQGQLALAEQGAQGYLASQGGAHGRVLEAEEMVLACVYLAQGRTDVALTVLDPLLPPAQAAGRMGVVLRVQLLRALVLHAQGRDDEAIATLEQSIVMAEPEGYMRIFVDEGTLLQPLLALCLRRREACSPAARRSRVRAYIEQILAALSGKSGPQDERPFVPHAAAPAQAGWVEPLSERELEVLRLIDSGLTNQEIARKLTVQVSTVKKHINRVFAKLAATHRAQAVARARELSLL